MVVAAAAGFGLGTRAALMRALFTELPTVKLEYESRLLVQRPCVVIICWKYVHGIWPTES